MDTDIYENAPPECDFLLSEWWEKWLSARYPFGPESTLPIDWDVPFFKVDTCKYNRWYKCRDIVVAYKWHHRRRPGFLITVENRPELIIESDFNMEEPEDWFLLLKGLADPVKIPLCIRISWAKEIVLHVLKA